MAAITSSFFDSIISIMMMLMIRMGMFVEFLSSVGNNGILLRSGDEISNQHQLSFQVYIIF